MNTRNQHAIVNALVFLGAMTIAFETGHIALQLPPLSWNSWSAVLACPYRVPPECVEPIPGL
jgi:hypothetical protein